MKLRIYDQDGRLFELNEVTADTLMTAIRDAGLDLTGLCGGCMSCGTCHVYVDSAWQSKVEPASDAEDAMLDVVEDRRENSRLSCQIKLTSDLDGLVVALAHNSAFA
ncbi:2Fe-2S ferredoxin [Bradyrhizobium sp. USDA 4341]